MFASSSITLVFLFLIILLGSSHLIAIRISYPFDFTLPLTITGSHSPQAASLVSPGGEICCPMPGFVLDFLPRCFLFADSHWFR